MSGTSCMHMYIREPYTYIYVFTNSAQELLRTKLQNDTVVARMSIRFIRSLFIRHSRESEKERGIRSVITRVITLKTRWRVKTMSCHYSRWLRNKLRSLILESFVGCQVFANFYPSGISPKPREGVLGVWNESESVSSFASIFVEAKNTRRANASYYFPFNRDSV